MLIRNALREEKLAELKAELEKESETEIKEELDFCREIQEVCNFIRDPDSWYQEFLGDVHIYGVDEIRKCWQENLDDEKKSQAASAYAWALVNNRPADQFSWPYLHFLCLGQDQIIWSFYKIETALERLNFLHADLARSLRSREKHSRYLTQRLVIRLKENTATTEAEELADRVLGILQIETGPDLHFTYDKMRFIAKTLTQRISLIRSFLDQYLIPLKEAMERVQQTCPNYLEMSCQDVAEILLAMHRQGRDLKFQDSRERAAYDHVYTGCRHDKVACWVLRTIFTTDSTEEQEAAWWLKVERSIAAKQVSK